jgi:hypothetical protein
LPVSIATRGKSTICPQAMIDEGKTGAGDHDFHCVNFTPSVNMIVDIKAPSSTADVGEVLQSFYRGMYVSVLMAVFVLDYWYLPIFVS